MDSSMSRLSVSKLKAYTRCSEAYFLERIVRPKLPRRPASWTIMGTALHECFYNWEISKRDYPLPRIVSDFQQIFDREIEFAKIEQPNYDMWFKAPRTKLVVTDIDNYRKRGVEGDVPNYYNYCLNSEWKVLELDDGFPALELEFEIQLRENQITGAIDKICEWPDGRITIEDLKSGRLNDTDNRQLGLYAYAANETLGLGRPIEWGRYFFSKSRINRPSDWIDLRRYSEDKLIRDFHRLQLGLEHEIYLPSPGDQCGLCSVRDYCSELGHLRPPTSEL